MINPNRISVIIPAAAVDDHLMQCIESLARTRPQPIETILVLDGIPFAPSAAVIPPAVRVIALAKRSGPAVARNIGARYAKGDLLLFIDADCTVQYDIIRRVSGIFRRFPDLSAVFGSYDDQPGQSNFLSRYKNLFHHYTHQHARTNASTFWGACGAVKTQVFVRFGGFSTAFTRPSVEDIDLGLRMTRAGFRIRLEKSLHVKHLKKYGPASLIRSDIMDRAIPWTRIMLASGRITNDLNLSWKNRISTGLLFFMAALSPISFRSPAALAAVLCLMILLCLINQDLYRFFYHKKGFLFVIGAVFWHVCYLSYAGGAFIAGALSHYRQTGRQKQR